MVSNRDLSDYIAWEKNRNSFFTNLKKSMNASYIIVLLGIIIFAFVAIQTANVNKNIIYLGLVLVIVAVLWRSRKTDKEPIPEPIIKVLAMLNMERCVSKEYPTGTIVTILPYCKMRYEGDWGAPFKPWKWEVGIRVTYPDLRKEELLVILHPYDGYVTGKVKMPAGYTGEHSHDLKVLLPTQFALKDDKPKSEG